MTDMSNNLNNLIKAAVNSSNFEPSPELNTDLKKKLVDASNIHRNKSSYINVWVCSLMLTLIVCAVVFWFVALSMILKILLVFIFLMPCFFGILLVSLKNKEELS